MLKKLAGNIRKIVAPKKVSPIAKQVASRGNVSKKVANPVAKPKQPSVITSKVSRVVNNPRLQKYNSTMNKISAPNTPLGYLPSRSVEIGKSIGDFAVRDPLSKVSVKQKPASYAKQAVSVLAKDKGIQDVVKKSAGVGSYLGTVASLGNSINKGLTKRALAKPVKKAVSKAPAEATKIAKKVKAPKVKTAESYLKEMAKRAARKQRIEDKFRPKGYNK